MTDLHYVQKCEIFFLQLARPSHAISIDYSVLAFGYLDRDGEVDPQPTGLIYRYDHTADAFLLQDKSMREVLWSFYPMIVPGNAIFSN